jgi:hypothetical protein
MSELDNRASLARDWIAGGSLPHIGATRHEWIFSGSPTSLQSDAAVPRAVTPASGGGPMLRRSRDQASETLPRYDIFTYVLSVCALLSSRCVAPHVLLRAFSLGSLEAISAPSSDVAQVLASGPDAAARVPARRRL